MRSCALEDMLAGSHAASSHNRAHTTPDRTAAMPRSASRLCLETTLESARGRNIEVAACCGLSFDFQAASTNATVDRL